jgi:hypothetical protein
MARSPRFQRPPGTEGKMLAGVRPCGCITAALAIDGPTPEYYSTEKDVREFYASMAKSGRETRWITEDDIRSKLGPCGCGPSPSKEGT